MNKNFLIAILSCIVLCNKVCAQDVVPTYRFDERHLAAWTETITIVDPSAHGGYALKRAANASSNTFWFGPYKYFDAGHYLVQFRLKVASNLSDANVLSLDIISENGSLARNLQIKPNMFNGSNEWQLFTLPIRIDQNAGYVEIRGLGFVSGITDVYLDHINVIPGDMKGLYADQFSVDGKGNVGIGTSTPTDKLSVKGKIRAQEIKVENSNWPDFVFTKDYLLPSLRETENHIKEKRHLPGIPSAAEVKAIGVDLGEMNAKLLQKIEELTLHLIAKENQIESQGKLVEMLVNKNEEHEDRLNLIEQSLKKSELKR